MLSSTRLQAHAVATQDLRWMVVEIVSRHPVIQLVRPAQVHFQLNAHLAK